jgi:hypothetical protein
MALMNLVEIVKRISVDEIVRRIDVDEIVKNSFGIQSIVSGELCCLQSIEHSSSWSFPKTGSF